MINKKRLNAYAESHKICFLNASFIEISTVILGLLWTYK